VRAGALVNTLNGRYVYLGMDADTFEDERILQLLFECFLGRTESHITIENEHMTASFRVGGNCREASS
jgi:hypothetical protein